MLNKYVIRNIETGQYLNDDYPQWGNLEDASIYEEVDDEYYSGAFGEVQLPGYCEWVLIS